MKVLQFIPSVRVADGGTTTYMQQLTPVLGAMCELHVCAMTPVEEFVGLQGCTLHSIPKSLFCLSAMKRAWLALLEEIVPDVVHINCCWMPQIALVSQWTHSWRAKRQISFPDYHLSIVMTPHGMLEPWIIHRHYLSRKLPAIWLYQRRAVAICDRLIATSEEEREHLLQLGWNRRVSLVQNGINVSEIVPKSTWRTPRELLFMSRIHPKKGLEMLLDAMIPLSEFHLTVAGDGEESYLKALRKRVHDLKLQDRVSFVGPIYGNEKWNLIRRSDALVLPSYSENYGLIIAESLACGTPVVTTQGTPWKSVQVYGAGWWIPAQVDGLTDALAQLSEMNELQMKEMSSRARTLSIDICDIHTKIAELYQLYLAK